jgi:hypothetical protein
VSIRGWISYPKKRADTAALARAGRKTCGGRTGEDEGARDTDEAEECSGLGAIKGGEKRSQGHFGVATSRDKAKINAA